MGGTCSRGSKTTVSDSKDNGATSTSLQPPTRQTSAVISPDLLPNADKNIEMSKEIFLARDSSKQLLGQAKKPSLQEMTSFLNRRQTSTTQVTNIVRKSREVREGAKTINQYILYDVVGRGAFGKVKKCCDVNGRPFACKIMKKTLLQRKRVGRFRNMLDHVWKEIAIWKKLKHPNIVNLFEVITEVDCDKIYMISEFVQGGEILPTLSGKNVKTQPLSNERARKYFRDICKGIRYLHNNRVAHRDIKPGNILLDRTTDEVKITDFGVSDIFEERIASGEVGNSIHLKAKMVESPQNIMPELHAVDGRSENARDDENKVSTGGFGGGGGGGGRSDLTRQSAGTTCFLSPEETTGKEFHAFPCDIWALGVTLYYMLLGTVPFLGDTVLQVYDRIQHDPVVIPVTMKEELDPLAVDLIYALLNKDHEARPTIDQVCEHPWLTHGGSLPLTSDATDRDVVRVTEEEVQHAVTRVHSIGSVVSAKKAALHMKQYRASHSHDSDTKDKKVV